jgi:hypothetical protein
MEPKGGMKPGEVGGAVDLQRRIKESKLSRQF